MSDVEDPSEAAVGNAPGRLAGVDGGGLGFAAGDDANVRQQMAVGKGKPLSPRAKSARVSLGEAVGGGGAGGVCGRGCTPGSGCSMAA